MERAVAREAGPTDAYLGQATRCRPGGRPRLWTCDVTHDESAGGVPYAVTVRRESSCFDARRTRPPVAASPARISGCVYLWQWQLL